MKYSFFSVCLAALISGQASAVVKSYEEGAAYVNNPFNFTSSTTAILSAGSGIFGLGQGSCSGVAISDYIVLTAAHCLSPSNMDLRADFSSFQVLVPSGDYRVALAQGPREPILRVDGDLERPSGSAATSFGLMRAAAIVSPGNGPDLAMILVAPGYNPLVLERFQDARLRTVNENLVLTNAGQGIQDPRTIIFNARVEGYSRVNAPQQLSGAVMLAEPGSPYFEFPSDGGWTNRGFVQSEEHARYHLETPIDAGGQTPNTMIYRHGRIVAGDSGGPLYGSVVGSNEQRVIGISVQGDANAPPGANEARWVSVGEYEGLLQGMRNALASIPATGTSPLYGHIPQRFRLSGENIVNSFSARLSPFSGMQYFDPIAGTAEELRVSGASQGILQLDLQGSQGDNLEIFSILESGQLEPALFTLGNDGIVRFIVPYRSLRIEGLDAIPGEQIVFGMSFQLTAFGVVNLEWTNIGAVTPVPEASTLLLYTSGLILLLARKRLRRSHST